MREKRIIAGRFVEGEKVTVSINLDQITRKVYYSADEGDLYIWYKGEKHFYYEFEEKF